MKVYQNIIVIFLCLLPLKLEPQSPVLINYDSDHGLPSSETYDLYQDENGFIWITSDRGLSKFDGLNFVNYNSRNGLPSDVVFHFFPENDTTVWITTDQYEIYHFNPLAEQLKFTPFFANETLKEKAKNTFGNHHIKRFKHVSNHFYFSFNKCPGYLVIDHKGKTETKHTLWKLKKHAGFANINKTFSFISVIRSDKIRSLLAEHPESKDTITLFHDPLQISNFSLHYGALKSIVNGNKIELLVDDRLIVKNNNNLKFTKLNSSGTDFIISNKNRIISTFSGIQILDSALQLKSTFLNNTETSSVLEDQNNSLWISSLKHGIYFIKNPEVVEIFMNKKKLPAYKIFFLNNYKFVISGFSSVSIFDQKNNFIYSNSKSAIYWHSNILMIPKNEVLSKIDFPSQTHQIGDEIYYSFNKSAKRFYISSSKNIISNSFLRIDKKHEISLPINTNDLHEYSEHSAILATDKGAFILHNFDSITPYHNSLNPTIKQPLKHVEQIKNAFLFVTESDGLLIEKDSFIVHIHKSSGLIDNKITDILIQNDSTVWTSSYSGLSKIKFSDNLHFFTIENYTKDNFGLLSNEIDDINSHEGNLWVCSKKGLFYFPINASPIKNIAVLTKDSIYVNGQKTIHNQLDIELNYKDEFQLYYSLVKFSNKNFRNITYSLNDKNWYPAPTKSIFIKFTDHGKHTLKITDEESNQILLNLDIFVKKPFWLKWPFFIIIAISIFVTMFLTASLSVRYKSLRLQRKVDSIKLELKALSAQINPHFTFNTINSIQHFLIKNDKKGGIQYLSEYAKLIRQSLYLSRKGQISLAEEIEFIELYCSLEQKRFDHHFKFKVINENNVNLNTTFIPSLLLQPVIENAILHGLNHDNKNGEIILTITNQKNWINISIIDNGCGLLNTNKLEKESLGLKILNERLALFNRTNKSINHVDIACLNSKDKTGSCIQFKVKNIANERHYN